MSEGGRIYTGPHAELTYRIIGCARRVYSELRFGFLERVYENALAMELELEGLEVVRQAPIQVHYRGEVVGQFVADLLVGGLVIIEIKAVDALIPAHEVQLVNYLRATPIEVGLLINFGPKFTVTRKILTNNLKASITPLAQSRNL